MGSAHRGLTHACFPLRQKQYSHVEDVIMAEPSAYKVPSSTQPERDGGILEKKDEREDNTCREVDTCRTTLFIGAAFCQMFD